MTAGSTGGGREVDGGGGGGGGGVVVDGESASLGVSLIIPNKVWYAANSSLSEGS